MKEKAKAIIQILFGLAIAAAVILLNDRIAALGNYGYAGVFIISALSSATLFIPAPGWAVVAAMATILDPIYVGLAAGIGSAFGELTGYMVGDGALSLAHRKKYEKFLALIKKNDAAAILVFSFLPNPFFDIAGIAAGAAKVPVWRYVLFCAAGRSLRYVLLAWLAVQFFP
ncbi:MAG: VTT domain-containing protein [Candidatus ainarchaeum sp.]|nr:VTT domain-containing protein [Candidatus ainarchaeum sp.]MDD5096227.1 VTT domain-containing protein [Candidatus ainarchaeum sp.]